MSNPKSVGEISSWDSMQQNLLDEAAVPCIAGFRRQFQRKSRAFNSIVSRLDPKRAFLPGMERVWRLDIHRFGAHHLSALWKRFLEQRSG
eukprot:IDg9829t1